MPLGEYVTGAVFFLATVGAAGTGAYVVLRRRYWYLPGLHRWLAYMVLATAALVFAEVLPAALGLFSRTSALVFAVVLLGAALAAPAGEVRAAAFVKPPRSARLSIVIAVVAVGTVTVYELARLRLLATQPITEIDMLSFHLPGVARFIQTGTIWRVDQFLPGFATAQYPNSGDFLLASTVVPWRDLAFVRFMPVPFFAFTGVAVYALGLELRASRAAAATMAAAVITVPAFSLLALDGLPDAISLATFAAGLVFLIRHVRFSRPADLVLAGLAFGVALGIKWYTATGAAIIVLVWAAGRLAGRERLLRVARQAGLLITMILLAGGIWLLRNLIESGNPIYPKAVSLFGLKLFAGSHGDIIDQFGYTVANYLGQPHILRVFVYPALKTQLGLTGLVLLISLVLVSLVSITSLRRSRERKLEPLLALAMVLVTLGICLDYIITPGSAYGPKNLPVETFANVRWLMPAILIGAALSARAATALGGPGRLLELAALAGAIDGIHLGPTVSWGASAEVLAGLAVLLALIAVGRRWGAGRRTLGRPALGALGVLLIALLGIVARIDESKFDRQSYAKFEPAFAWIEAHAPAHHRIGIAGTWTDNGVAPTLPAFGPRLGNWVGYIGDPVVHSLHLPAGRRAFAAEVRRGGYDLLVIGLRDTDNTDTWAQQLGYRLVTRSSRLALYQATAAVS